jgi:hypothetical protein
MFSSCALRNVNDEKEMKRKRTSKFFIEPPISDD